ncbi:hypothetical protein Scep_028438 [Stephania cephalantha]|uniref:Uncharacterized protein n=1 Tax=Stephania cephalantha TaxID=152367 RepID=A0AAP0HM31_9MAGN
MAVAAAAGRSVMTSRGAATDNGGDVSAAAAIGSGMAATHARTVALAIDSDRGNLAR